MTRTKKKSSHRRYIPTPWADELGHRYIFQLYDVRDNLCTNLVAEGRKSNDKESKIMMSQIAKPKGMTYADPPLPITATRFPLRSREVSHCEEWKRGPLKLSKPGIGGIFGMWSSPWADRMTSAIDVVRVPDLASSIVILYAWRSVCHSAAATLELKAIWDPKACLDTSSLI